MSTIDTDKQAIGLKWAEILAANTSQAALTAPAALVNPQNIFCKDWSTAKKVLQALQPIVPQPGPIIIGVIIALGDAAYQHVCPVPASGTAPGSGKP